MHPDNAEGFAWDDANRDELARHHITPYEVEQVFDNEPRRWRRNKGQGTGNWLMIGRTDGGRILTVVVLWRETEAVIRPITGWDSVAGERRHLGR